MPHSQLSITKLPEIVWESAAAAGKPVLGEWSADWESYQNSNLIIFEYVQTSYTFWSPKIIFRTCVLHSCYVNRFLVHAAQIEKVANYLQLGICHSNFQNFLQYFDHVLFPRTLQYNSCCETGCCIVHRLREPAIFFTENFNFTMLNFFKYLSLSWAQKSSRNKLQENRLLPGTQIEKTANICRKFSICKMLNLLKNLTLDSAQKSSSCCETGCCTNWERRKPSYKNFHLTICGSFSNISR